MSRLLRRWQKDLDRRMTIMVIPHGTAAPRQVSFSVPFLALLFLAWTGVTGWAGFMASERFDYWRARANTHFLKLKLQYFTAQLHQSRATLDEVKEMEGELRTLIGLGSREAIIQAEGALRPLESAPVISEERVPATGGPSALDAAVLQSMLDGKAPNINIEDVGQEVLRLRTEAEHRLASVKALRARIDEERRIFRATPNIWPVNGYLTSHFGPRLSPIYGYEQSHKGMDIAGPSGTPVRATADGTVRVAGWGGGYGRVVVIDHGYGFSTRYGHNRQILVKSGDRVTRGQIIALMGETGNATGPHVHYEVWHNGRAMNPGKFMKEHSS